MRRFLAVVVALGAVGVVSAAGWSPVVESWEPEDATTALLVEDHRAPLVVLRIEVPVGRWSAWPDAAAALGGLEALVDDVEGRWRREADRRRELTQSLARYFGKDAREPTEIVEQDWSAEEWTRGCPVGVVPPGVLTTFGTTLRQPVGRLHWAGTETATVWNGYLEGALEAGERAAREVLRRL